MIIKGDMMMLENKKFKRIINAEAVMPWVVAVLGGIAAVFYFSAGKYFGERLDEEYRRAEKLCNIFYNCSMWYGIGLSVVLLIVGLSSFVIMLVHLFGAKKEKYSVERPLIIFLWSGLCVLETFVLMLLVICFTYGQGV